MKCSARSVVRFLYLYIYKYKPGVLSDAPMFSGELSLVQSTNNAAETTIQVCSIMLVLFEDRDTQYYRYYHTVHLLESSFQFTLNGVPLLLDNKVVMPIMVIGMEEDIYILTT